MRAKGSLLTFAEREWNRRSQLRVGADPRVHPVYINVTIHVTTNVDAHRSDAGAAPTTVYAIRREKSVPQGWGLG